MDKIEIITLDQLYRETMIKALARAGTLKGAVRLMGISERTGQRWIKIYGLELPTRHHPRRATNGRFEKR